MNALELKGLTKRYKDFALDGLDLTVPSGCILGLIGENGAGKSTTIRLILDMIPRDAGTVTILGRDNRDDLPLTMEEVGVVLDEVGIPQCLDTRQVGKVMAHTYRNWDQAIYEGYLKRFDLPDKKSFKDFSKGMKMKLGLCVALSHHPRLLILDEATSGLDPVVRDELLDIFCDFTRDEDHTILISSHIVSDLEKICDYVAFLHHGKLILCQEKDRLYEMYGILRCDRTMLAGIDPAGVIGVKEGAYGCEAIVAREVVPIGVTLSPIDIEQLFIFMVKGEK